MTLKDFYQNQSSLLAFLLVGTLLWGWAFAENSSIKLSRLDELK